MAKLCVAISRGTSKTELNILIENDDDSCGSQTQNVVYREILDAVDAASP